MPIVIPVPIPAAPPAPQRNDPATFEERNDAAVEYQFETLPGAINEHSEAAYQNALESKSQAETATSKAGAAAASATTAINAAGAAVAAATQTNEDRAATQAARIATEQNAQATAADRVKTGQDRVAVEAALESVAGGPVISIGRATGVVKVKTVNGEDIIGEGNIKIETSRIGDVLVTSGDPAPGFIPADGSTYLRAAYPELSAQLGTVHRLGPPPAAVGAGRNNSSRQMTVLDDGTILAVNGSQYVTKSLDNGYSWSEHAPLGNGAGLSGIAASGNTVYAIGSSVLFKSTDGGRTWVSIVGSMTGSFNWVLANGDVVVVGNAAITGNYIISYNAGVSFVTGSVFGGTGIQSVKQLDNGDIAMLSTAHVTVINDAGSGAAWTSLPASIADFEFDGTYQYCVSHFGLVYRKLPGAGSWTEIATLSVVSSQPKRMFRAGPRVFISLNNGPVTWCTSDSGVTWQAAPIVPVNTTASAPNIQHSAPGGRTYIIGLSRVTFTDNGLDFYSYDLTPAALARSGPDLWMADTTGSIWKSPSSDGRLWLSTFSTLSLLTTSSWPTLLSVSGSVIIAASVLGEAHASTDGGATWLKLPFISNVLRVAAFAGKLWLSIVNTLYKMDPFATTPTWSVFHTIGGMIFAGKVNDRLMWAVGYQIYETRDGETTAAVALIPRNDTAVVSDIFAGGGALVLTTNTSPLYLSLDLGRTWRVLNASFGIVSTGLLNSVDSDGDVVAIGTINGFVFSDDRGETFQASAYGIALTSSVAVVADSAIVAGGPASSGVGLRVIQVPLVDYDPAVEFALPAITTPHPLRAYVKAEV